MGFKSIIVFSVIFVSLRVDAFNYNYDELFAGNETEEYTPDWESLDTRPLPDWYDEAKFGIFIHWGVFSVPSFGSEWFWWYWKGENYPDYVDFMEKNYKADFSYQDFAHGFTAEFFNASEWANLFKKSGAKYVVLTTKHHEGYTLWPSPYSIGWNSQDVGPHIDIVGALAAAVKKAKMTFGVYYSLFEWFNPLWLQDNESNFNTSEFATYKSYLELTELVELYKPEIIWSDGDADADDDYWQSKEFLAWLYNESPVKDTVVVNDRWGKTSCTHGDYYTCGDRFNPGELQDFKWENAMTIDKKSWGYRRNANLEDYLSTQELISELVTTVSCGGNLLLNVGPTKEGIIEPIYEERLLDIGSWLDVNGEAIFNTKPWKIQNDTSSPNTWYTESKDSKAVYAIVMNWPHDEPVTLDADEELFNRDTKITMLGAGEIHWIMINHAPIIQFPSKSEVKTDWAWVLKIEP